MEEYYLDQHQRSLPLGDHFGDRWERAKRLNFGKGTNIYDSSYVIGDVKVGANCWIGMFTILDGSGGLVIGDNCTISAGVHIYSHDNLHATLSNSSVPIVREPTEIANNCYIGPYAVISKGVSLGSRVVVGAHSLVKDSFPNYAIVAGVPAKHIGTVKVEGDKIMMSYFSRRLDC